MFVIFTFRREWSRRETPRRNLEENENTSSKKSWESGYPSVHFLSTGKAHKLCNNFFSLQTDLLGGIRDFLMQAGGVGVLLKRHLFFKNTS